MPRSALIIEDDAESRRVMAELFTHDDWKVLEANDGDVGLELALRNRPELILCDLLMPKSNGFQVCRAIREQLQPTKIIVVSGRDYGVDRTSALQAGADEYLLKPVTWELLSHTIDRLLPEIPRRPRPKAAPERESVPARIRLWGVRGSIPVPGKSTVRYGGNTSCVEVRADGEIIVLDAGDHRSPRSSARPSKLFPTRAGEAGLHAPLARRRRRTRTLRIKPVHGGAGSGMAGRDGARAGVDRSQWSLVR